MANVIDKVAGLVVGPQGPQGPQGPKGDTGQTGPQGAQGATGATPNLTMGTVTTLEPDSQATATITGTAENPVLNLGLPKGRTGEVSQAEFDEVAGDVTKLKEDLSEVEQALTRKEIVETLTLSAGLMNIYGQKTDVSAYENGSLSVTQGQTYDVEGFYYGGNFPAIVLLNGATVVSFVSGEGYRTQYSGTIKIPSGVDTLVVNGRVADYRAKATLINGFEKVDKPKSFDCVLVGSTSAYDYTDINAAVVDNPNAIIYVDYGIYETEIQNLTTNKKIVGKDVDLCVLNGTNKDYDTPPIEIAGGIVKNLTVNMINNPSADHKGYCLHSDNAATENNTLLVENCKFKCTGQHAVGIGLRPDETLIFNNCYFEQIDNATDTNPIYIHNGAGSNPAVVKFHNCYFHGYEYCMKLQAWGSGNSVQFEFINCTCISDTYGVSDDCVWTDYVSGSTHDANKMHEFSGKFTLLSTSHGNNVTVLNS